MHYKCQIRLGNFKTMKSNSVTLRVRKRATGVFPVVLLFVRRRENVKKAKPNKKRTLKTWVRFCIIRNIFGKSKAEIKGGGAGYRPYVSGMNLRYLRGMSRSCSFGFVRARMATFR